MNEIKAKMRAICEGQSVEQLKEVVKNLYDMHDESSGPAFDVALDVLMEKMPEHDFAMFCAEIE